MKRLATPSRGSLALSAAVLAALVFPSGCNGNAGGAGLGNAAISASLDPLFASMRAGDPNLSALVTAGTIDNPFAAPTSFTQSNLALGARSEDGSATVDVRIDVTHDSGDGSRTVHVTISEAGSGHVFFDAQLQLGPLVLDARPIPLGFSGISPSTGEGEAFVVVHASQSLTYQRTFANTSPGGATLIDSTISPQPVASTSGSYTLETDLLLDYVLTRGAQGLQATLTALDAIGFEIVHQVSGDANASPFELQFTDVRVAGAALDPHARDLAFAVGADALASGFFHNADRVDISGVLQGGVAGASGQSGITTSSPLQLTASSFTGSALSLSGQLNLPSPEIGDGELDLGAISFEYSSGAASPTLDHTLDTVTGFGAALRPLDLSQLLFPHARAAGARSILIFY